MMDPRRVLFIDPPSRHFEGNKLFDRALTAHGGINIGEPFAHLRRRLSANGVPVHTADLIDAPEFANVGTKVYMSFGMRDRYQALERRDGIVLSALFAFECPIVEPSLYRDLYSASRVFRRIYSFSTEEALEPFLSGPVPLRRFRIPQFYDDVDEELWQKRERGFLVMINGNKAPPISWNELYTERLRALAFFARYDDIDLYGVGWNGPVLRVGDDWLPLPLRRVRHELRKRWHQLRPPQDEIAKAIRATYRGQVIDKAAALAAYDFAICYENARLDGWVTEKIFDCFYSGTIPIYLGAPDIDVWIPPECFIDMRGFSGYDELRTYLHDLSPTEVETYREAAREFVRSDAYRPFTKQAFADLIESIVEEDAGPVRNGGGAHA